MIQPRITQMHVIEAKGERRKAKGERVEDWIFSSFVLSLSPYLR